MHTYIPKQWVTSGIKKYFKKQDPNTYTLTQCGVDMSCTVHVLPVKKFVDVPSPHAGSRRCGGVSVGGHVALDHDSLDCSVRYV